MVYEIGSKDGSWYCTCDTFIGQKSCVHTRAVESKKEIR